MSEREFGYRPLIFLSNGYATEFVDDEERSIPSGRGSVLAG